jgi:hypothetical protein
MGPVVGRYLYLPPRPSISEECLMTHEFCTAMEESCTHPRRCHILQFLMAPRREESRPYYLVVPNGVVADAVTDYSRSSVFVVVLGWASEFLFRTFPPSVVRSRPPEVCSVKFKHQNEMRNLYVYEVRMADLSTAAPAVSAVPLFYAPSDRSMLDRAGPRVWAREESFGDSFSLAAVGNYAACANKRFLCVSQSGNCILFFSLAADRTSRPFGLNLSEPITPHTLVTSAEMYFVAGIRPERETNINDRGKMKICCLCPDKAESYQVEMARVSRDRIPTIRTARALVHETHRE